MLSIILSVFFVISKIQAQVDIFWTKTLGSNGGEEGYSVRQTEDGGYIITGVIAYFGTENHDVWLIKTNSSGDTLWTKTYGGSEHEWGYSVQQTNDEGYIITGVTSSFGTGGHDVWLIKTNAAGDTLWTKTFGGIYSDQGYSLQQTKDGEYIITGYTDSFGARGGGDIWLIKTNPSGDTLWTKTYGGNGSDIGCSVQQTMDGGYIITGETSSFGAGGIDVWLIKTTASGDTLWTKTFGGSSYDYGQSVQQTIDEGYIITGLTMSFGAGNHDIWLIKTTPDVSTIEKAYLGTPSDYRLSQNFPNPFNPKTTFEFSITKSDRVTVSIYNISGQLFESKTINLNPGLYSYEFDGIKYSSGIYFYRISTSSGYTAGRKMVLLK
jgi:hypothetical protein